MKYKKGNLMTLTRKTFDFDGKKQFDEACKGKFNVY